MVTNADYAAYSRATGTPYPRNQEEQMELYPLVRNWRNNQLKNEDENNIGQNIAIGALGLGGLALASAAGRKAIAQRAAQRRAAGGGGRQGGVGFQDNPPPAPKDPSGGGGSGGILADLPSVTRRGAYDRAAAATPDPGVGKDVQYRNPGSGGTDLSMLVTDETTGEIYRRGGGQSSRSQQAREAIQDVNNRVDQLLKDLEPDVAREERAMMAQESARQTRNVNEVKRVKAEEILKEIQQENTLVEYQKNREPLIEEQSAAALNTAEDQSDGRFLRELQRNEDIDMTLVNEDVLDASSTQTAQDALFRENQLVQDARDYLIRQEIDLKYDYTPEESRQAAAVGQALERIQNNPTRVAAEGIIDELRTEARAVADRAKFAKEQRRGKTGELPGYREVDNIRQRKEQKTLSALDAPRETIEAVLTGEDAPIETNLQGRQLRGGKVDEAGDVRFYGAGAETTDASTGARVGKQGEQYKKKAQLEAMFNRYSDDELEQIAANKARIAYGDMMQQDLDELQTAQRVLQTRAQTSMDKGIDMSGPQQRALARGRKGVDVSEASRKRFENQRPVPASQPVQDVARSMETLRQGMSVEPSEAAPVTPDIRNIGIGFEGDKEIIGAIGPSDAYTGAARDAAGSLKNVVVGESAPLVQGGIVSNPEVAAQIEDQSQAFLQRAISGGLTQKQTPGYVYTSSQTTEPVADVVVGPGGRRRQLEIFGNQPLDTPYLSTGKSSSTVVNPNIGPDPSQRLGYTRYYVGTEKTGSKPAGVVTGVSPTVNIDYASMPQSDVYRPTDIGRTVPNLSASQGSVKSVPGYLQSLPKVSSRQPLAGPAQVNYRPPAPGYTDIGDRPAPTEAAPIGPLTQSPGLPKIGRQVRERSGYYAGPGQTESTYLTQYGTNIKYPRTRGEERFLTEQLINDPSLGAGPVKMPNRFRDQFVIERPRGY